MKKNIILFSALMGIIGTSCVDYLDAEKDLKDRMTIEEVFSKYEYADAWLANAYYALTNIPDQGKAPYTYADDLYNSDTKSIKEVTYNEESWQDNWRDAYQGIRQASIYIENIHMCKDYDEEEVKDYRAQARFLRAYLYWKLLQKYGPIPLLPEDGLDYTDDYADLSYPRNSYDECVEYINNEFLLAAHDLPLTRNLMAIARPTRGAALAARAKLLLYAASPLMNGNKDSYAEKLVDNEGRRLLNAEYSEEKWAKAAAAALDVMNLNQYKLYTAARKTTGTDAYPATIEPYDDGNFSRKNWPNGYADIDPFESYRTVFNGELISGANPEIIFTRATNQSGSGVHHLVLTQLPLFAKGENKTCMTQKQVDAYYMADGTDCPGMNSMYKGLAGYEGRVDSRPRVSGFITEETKNDYPEVAGNPNNRVGISLQYVGREPRFYASVAFSGATWHLQNAIKEEDKGPYQCWYYRGSKEGRTQNSNWLLTGIGVMKFVSPRDTNDDSNPWGSQHILRKSDAAIRYAEVLMIYAEAINELTTAHNIASWDGTTTYSLSRSVDELKKGIQPIRIRAGVPDFSDDVYSDVNKFRAKLKRERQIELMGEGHRYFDLRRWKDAPVEESVPIYGCNTLMTVEQRDLFYSPVEVELLNCFSEKTYFWPIHRDEIRKNIRMTQNPGWQIRK